VLKNKFLAVHHLAIICSDYQKSKYFYAEVLGFKVIKETFRNERKSYKLDLKINENIQIELFSFPDPPSRPSRPEACGLRHLAFAVTDINEAVKELEQKGVSCEEIRIDEITNKKFTFFSDPDDLPLELYEL
jgi:glyoxylase I family protein